MSGPAYHGGLNNHGYHGGSYSGYRGGFGYPYSYGYPYPYGGFGFGFATGGIGYPYGYSFNNFPLSYGMGSAYGAYRVVPVVPLQPAAPAAIPYTPAPVYSTPAAAVVNLTVPDGENRVVQRHGDARAGRQGDLYFAGDRCGQFEYPLAEGTLERQHPRDEPHAPPGRQDGNRSSESMTERTTGGFEPPAGHRSLEPHEQVAAVDLGAGADQHFGHAAAELGIQRRLHLHRFE